MLDCPLCHQLTSEALTVQGRSLHRCPRCRLVFADPSEHPSAADARDRYRHHRNSIADAGYVAFLNQAVEPALKYLRPGGVGLDFGSGPHPTLSALVKRQGFACDDYDPIFGPAQDRSKRYDFIFATECFEHFVDPAAELDLIQTLLKPGGVLTVMTERWDDKTDFSTWYYLRDFTHVAFYHPRTFAWIGERYGFSAVYSDAERVIVLRKAA